MVKPFVGDNDDSEVRDMTPSGGGGDPVSPSPGNSLGKGNRANRSLMGATPQAAATRQKYKFSAYVVMTTKVGTRTNKADAAGVWEDMALNVIEKCQGLDASCWYIPPNLHAALKPIYWRADKPKELSG